MQGLDPTYKHAKVIHPPELSRVTRGERIVSLSHFIPALPARVGCFDVATHFPTRSWMTSVRDPHQELREPGTTLNRGELLVIRVTKEPELTQNIHKWTKNSRYVIFDSLLKNIRIGYEEHNIVTHFCTTLTIPYFIRGFPVDIYPYRNNISLINLFF